MNLRHALLLLVFILLSPPFLFGQIDSGRVDIDADSLLTSDSVMVAEPEFFGAPTVPFGDTESEAALKSLPAGWSPEISSPHRRESLLGLQEKIPLFLSYNRVDGLYLGIGVNAPVNLFRQARVQGYLGFGYGLGSHYWQVAGGLRRDFLSRRAPLRVGIDGHIYTDTRDAWKMSNGENTAASLIAGFDTRDYYQRRGFAISLQQFLNPRVGARVEYRLDNYRNSQREIKWSLFGPEQPFRENPPVREGQMSSVVVSILADYMTLRSWNSPQFGVEAQAEFGSLEGDFAHYTIDARTKVTIVDKVLWIAAHGRAMSATGNAPPQKLFTIGGIGTLPGYPQNEYGGNRLLLLQTDLLFAPIESISTRIILSNDFGAIAMADTAAGPLTGFPGDISSFKYSPGIYIGSATGTFRIGAAFRTDVMETPRFVLRFSQPF
jgi:hypothetical protein